MSPTAVCLYRRLCDTFLIFLYSLSGVFLVCWVPFFTCNILNAICIKYDFGWYPGDTAFMVTTWLGYINSCINPLIYTIFNPEFRKAFKKLLHVKWNKFFEKNILFHQWWRFSKDWNTLLFNTVTLPTKIKHVSYSRENKRGLILNSRDFRLCLFSSHAYFRVMLI